jgi:hypothetical protein
MERYRAIPFEWYHLGFNRELVQLLTEDRSIFLPTSAAATLHLCRNFKTLTGHAESACRALKMADQEKSKIARTLEQLGQRGLLLSESGLYTSITASNEPPRPISAITILTANRIRPCLTALSSFAQNAAEFSRRADFIIMDDSVSGDSSSALIQELEKYVGICDGRLFYAGRRGKAAYVAELEKLGIDRAVASFALLGEPDDSLPTIGANRNCVLLETLGAHVLSSDDDVVCRNAPHPDPSDQIRLCGHIHARDLWFFKNRVEAVDAVNWQSVDLLREHEHLLGRPVGDLVLESMAGPGVNLEDICDHFLASLLSGAARVRATVSGIVGDSGGRFPSWMLASSGRTRANLLASKMAYETALTSRELLGVACGPTIAHHPFAQTAMIGLDNARALPPFYPVSRGEDSMWGVLAMSVSPHCFFGHVPFAALHDAQPGRVYEENFEYRIAELMISLISSYPPVSGGNSLKLLGGYLREMSGMPDQDFWNWVTHAVRIHNSHWMPELQSVLNTFEQCPDYWEHDIREWHSQMATLLAEPSNFVPVELRERYPADIAQAKTKSLVKKTGQLLCEWPDIVEAARELKQRGLRLAVPVTTTVTA